MNSFKGIFPAVITPMKEDFSINYSDFEKYLRWLKSQGVNGFAINVDTGEGQLLNREEKEELIQIGRKVASEDLRVIAGVIGSSTKEAINEAREAVNSGADALLIFPNSFFRGKPQNPKLIFKYHNSIAQEVEVDILIFNLQDDLGGCLYERETLEKLLAIPQVKAIKEASFDISVFKGVKSFLDKQEKKIDFLTGNDNFIYESFLLGADGGLLGACAQFTELQVRCYNSVLKKDFQTAHDFALKFQPLIDKVFMPPVRNYRARTKYSLKLQGIIQNSTVRPPLMSISQEEKDVIEEMLENEKLI
ncbi:MAG: Dihydrodipicolinate synthase/N-acetylneuraminate lyase [Promethearchaeota archaeon]|nr:MAG: Dihydrodipicolinate synthase/N-acetylneuraminate lyase [Candidatus Lokiarchaeota archaeon]